MKKIFIAFLLALISSIGFSQYDKNVPVFATTDSLNVYGPWQTLKLQGDKGEEISISCRFLVRKKFMLTCLFSVEIRNDGDKDLKVHFLAGNKGTNYYTGQIGVVNEKVKIAPKATSVVDYRLPTKTNDKADTDPMVCKKCKELEHVFMFAK